MVYLSSQMNETISSNSFHSLSVLSGWNRRGGMDKRQKRINVCIRDGGGGMLRVTYYLNKPYWILDIVPFFHFSSFHCSRSPSCNTLNHVFHYLVGTWTSKSYSRCQQIATRYKKIIKHDSTNRAVKEQCKVQSRKGMIAISIWFYVICVVRCTI